jgi:predicted nucleotidyltransferase component of viral defense system
MASFSHLKKSDVSLLNDKATELGCNVGYLEKDYYLVQLIKSLQDVALNNEQLIFTGGTALSKGYKVTKRFSEDCDFILLSKEKGYSHLRKLKERIKNHLQNYGFTVKKVASYNKYKNVSYEVEYPSLSGDKKNLRQDLKLEVIYKERLLTRCQFNSIQSFLAECKSQNPEVDKVECLSIDEICVGKLSALVWRTLDKSEELDPTLIRHLYDLSSLSSQLSASKSFSDLCLPVLKKDLNERAKPTLEFSAALGNIISELQTNPIHKINYQDYLENFIYEPLSSNLLTFENAMINLKDLVDSLKKCSNLIINN